MNACGLVVEYNPFHNGHAYHIEQSRKESGAACIIAVMSGSFLQRGEPAIVDKFHRADAALSSGADIIVELPYAFAVQGSNYFAEGAVRILNELGVNSLCFGSESGDISKFIYAYEQLQAQHTQYQDTLKTMLNKGISFPSASTAAYRAAGVDPNEMDLSQPNNILGFSYVRAIMDGKLPIRPLTIKRHKSNYHDPGIIHDIASATSIRQELNKHSHMTEKAQNTLPEPMRNMLTSYQTEAGTWHMWEHYFPFLYYKVLTMTPTDLAAIQGVDEGLEHRIKKTGKTAHSFQDWMSKVKTKRYTWTRLQRMFVHILTGTKKSDIAPFINPGNAIPYIRLLGMTSNGQTYLNTIKKGIKVPLVTQLSDANHGMLDLEERTQRIYYSILGPVARQALFQRELTGPIRKQ